jgi:hypothetical protein
MSQRDLYYSLVIIIMIKSRMRWTGHIAGTGRRGMLIAYWWERQTEIDHQEDINVGGRIILK